MRRLHSWLRHHGLTPLGRWERKLAREYDAMLKRHEARTLEAFRSGELQRNSPRRVVSLDCMVAGCRWGDSDSRRCECRKEGAK